MFLTAYLRTDLARYFMFHTSSNWGVYRPEVHVEEILRLPLPLPDQLDDPQRGQQIVDEVAQILDVTCKQSASKLPQPQQCHSRGQHEDRTAYRGVFRYTTLGKASYCRHHQRHCPKCATDAEPNAGTNATNQHTRTMCRLHRACIVPY